MKTYKSNGKLLITGEYLVLDGALSFALPTKFGQSLSVVKNENSIINWKSFDNENNIWFNTEISFNDLKHNQPEGNEIKNRLISILKTAQDLNPEFLNNENGFNIETHLQFPRLWGLGTSSTLINNIANWASVDAYKLLELTFGGSGYDIACAEHNTPITYQLFNNTNNRRVEEANFNPLFKDNIYFVYLNQKQNSREGIAQYKANKHLLTNEILEVNDITQQFLNTTSLLEFEQLITKHEQIISKIIKQSPVKERLFSDFDGTVKSLGAWGGDFVMVTSNKNPTTYFNNKGFNTVLKFSDLIL